MIRNVTLPTCDLSMIHHMWLQFGRFCTLRILLHTC